MKRLRQTTLREVLQWIEYVTDMADIKRVVFEEVDGQWKVVLIDAKGDEGPAEPFPGFGGEGFSKLEQVLWRLRVLGLRRTSRIPDDPSAARYGFDVAPLDKTADPSDPDRRH